MNETEIKTFIGELTITIMSQQKQLAALQAEVKALKEELTTKKK